MQIQYVLTEKEYEALVRSGDASRLVMFAHIKAIMDHGDAALVLELHKRVQEIVQTHVLAENGLGIVPR